MDTIVNQLHILSLLVGTGARAGDLGFVDKDVEAALKLREIELFLAPGKAVLRNVVLRIRITCYKGNRLRDGLPIQHKLTTFERPENAVLDPVVLTIAAFLRRGLLSGTLEEILAKAAARPDRQIQIGTPSDTNPPVLLHLTQNASYGDHNLKGASSDNIRHAVNEIGGSGLPNLGKLGSHATRRGAAQDANHLKDGQFKSGTSHEVSAALGHSKVSAVKGLTNMYANGHIENLGRARESLLPRITPFINLAIGAVRDTSPRYYVSMQVQIKFVSEQKS